MTGGRTGAHFVIDPSQKGSPGSGAAVNLVDLQMLIASNQLLTWGQGLGSATEQNLTDRPSPSRRMYWEVASSVWLEHGGLSESGDEANKTGVIILYTREKHWGPGRAGMCPRPHRQSAQAGIRTRLSLLCPQKPREERGV